MTMITGSKNIENVRRLTIRHALKMRVNLDMWPNSYWQKNCLSFLRSEYGWTGRTAKQALKFMEELGDVK